MPPRRGQRKSVSTTSASGSQVPQIEDVSQQISDAVSEWDSKGHNALLELLVFRVDASSSTTLSSVPLSHVFASLLASGLDPSALAILLSSLIEGFPEDVREERTEMLGEALADVIEVMEEDKEDRDDLGKEDGEMEVDGEGKKWKGGEKGLEVFKLLLESKHLPSHIPNLLLSPQLLLSLNLHPSPHNPQGLQRAYVKRNTTLFFKQSKYNLLRESSEGFSGLIVLLTGPDALTRHLPAEEIDEARKARAKRVWAKVMGLIGYFNLSPPRVLDIVLEIASCHVAVHWRFFLELLRCSPWGAAAAEIKGKGKEKAVDVSWVDEEVQSVAESMRQGGDRVLSQVLGVKFGFYQRPEDGDTPMGLVYLAALIVKHGFVSLSDLLPFLSPDDIEMANIYKRYLASMSARSGPSNALSNSTLLDDEIPSSATVKDGEAGGPPPKLPPEQRILLLQALLSIGELPAALLLLGRFPWIALTHPAVADSILRIVAYALEDVYSAISDVPDTGSEEDDLDMEELAPTALRVAGKEIIPSILVPCPPGTSSRSHEFFFPAWREGLERWSTADELLEKAPRWLSPVRGLGGRSVDLMSKICRIGAAHFIALRRSKEEELGLQHGVRSKDELRMVEPSSAETQPWLDLIRISLLPALSASGGTAAFDIELWSLLRHLPYPVRYALYGEWRDGTCNFRGRNACPVAAHAAAENTREIKKALSRVTASQSAPSGPGSTDREPARALAKLSHTNPCALWTTAVTQVKAYPNIGQFIVEAGRYMTQLSMDVATFTLVDTLSDDNISRLNPTGTDVAQWLSSLATFVGDFNRRYANMDLEPILQFIINRLMRSESADLNILDKLISIMSGVTQVENDAISDNQLLAYATGREMVKEAFHSTILTIARPVEGDPGVKAKEAPFDKAKSTKKSLPRFVNALRHSSLAMPIWIALAQTRQGAADKMASAPIKAMTLMQDTVHEVFTQYGDLLSEQLTSDEHINLTPDLVMLVNEFGLDFAMAFQILRPRLNAELERVKSEEKAAVQKRLAAEKQALSQRIASPTKEASPALPSPKSAAIQLDGEEAGDIVMEDGKEELVNGTITLIPPPKSTSARQKVWWPSALTLTMQQARSLLPQEVNDIMSAPFFVIFWHLCMSDISFSAESYQKAIDKITSLEKDVAGWRTAAVTDQKVEKARLKARAELLAKERDAQQVLVNGSNRRRLRLESSKWFGRPIADKGLQSRLAAQLHQYCFYPRSLLTPSDAVYVAKFIRIAHDLGTVGFSTVFTYNNFFNDRLAACIFSSTTNEARNFGRCLSALMADLDAWHQDESHYKREALGISEDAAEGQAQRQLPGMMFRPKPTSDLVPMSWQQFRNFYAKCHNTLARALVSCWAQTDFMHIKNAITVGLQVIKYFPVMDTNGKAIEDAVKSLVAGNNGTLTPDVQHQCQAYLRNLTRKQTTRPLISPAAFHSTGIPKTAPAASTNGPAKVAPTAPRSSGDATPIPNGDGVKTEVELSPAAEPGTAAASGASGPQVLRQKLEQTRSRNVSGTALPKEELGASPTSSASQVARTDTPLALDASTPQQPGENGEYRKPAATPPPTPAGPRATRSGAPTGPARLSQGNVQASSETRNTPTGPSRPSPAATPQPSPKPAPSQPSSMGPPNPSLSIDEARAAARARKFGMISKPLPPSAPSAPAAQVKSELLSAAEFSASRNQSLTPEAPRRSPPPIAMRSARRSGSVESRVSERSRRDTRDREDRERDRTRDTRGVDTIKPRGNGTRSRTASERKPGDEAAERRRQEGLLQARHERLVPADKKVETRRSSRDGHRRETEKEREERKAKERDTDRAKRNDRERTKDGAIGENEDAGLKRKRDEPPRRIDDPLDRHEDRRDRREPRRGDRRDDGRDDRRDGPRDDRRDSRDDRHADRRDDRNERGIDRQSREPREAPIRERTRLRSPDKREARTTRNEGVNGDRTPKRDTTPKESLPLRLETRNVNGQNDRIVEPPRSTRSSVAPRDVPLPSRSDVPRENVRPSSDSLNGSRTVYALPPRPGNNQAPSHAPTPPRPVQINNQAPLRAPTPPHPAQAPTRVPAPPHPAEGDRASIRAATPPRPPQSSLAARMGPAPSFGESRELLPRVAPPRVDALPVPDASTAQAANEEVASERENGAGSEPRKRPLEETGSASREASPGEAKRVKIDRDKVRSHDRRGREATGGNRLLASAIKSAAPGEK